MQGRLILLVRLPTWVPKGTMANHARIYWAIRWWHIMPEWKASLDQPRHVEEAVHEGY